MTAIYNICSKFTECYFLKVIPVWAKHYWDRSNAFIGGVTFGRCDAFGGGGAFGGCGVFRGCFAFDGCGAFGGDGAFDRCGAFDECGEFGVGGAFGGCGAFGEGGAFDECGAFVKRGDDELDGGDGGDELDGTSRYLRALLSVLFLCQSGIYLLLYLISPINKYIPDLGWLQWYLVDGSARPLSPFHTPHLWLHPLHAIHINEGHVGFSHTLSSTHQLLLTWAKLTHTTKFKLLPTMKLAKLA